MTILWEATLYDRHEKAFAQKMTVRASDRWEACEKTWNVIHDLAIPAEDFELTEVTAGQSAVMIGT